MRYFSFKSQRLIQKIWWNSVDMVQSPPIELTWNDPWLRWSHSMVAPFFRQRAPYQCPPSAAVCNILYIWILHCQKIVHIMPYIHYSDCCTGNVCCMYPHVFACDILCGLLVYCTSFAASNVCHFWNRWWIKSCHHKYNNQIKVITIHKVTVCSSKCYLLCVVFFPPQDY